MNATTADTTTTITLPSTPTPWMNAVASDRVSATRCETWAGGRGFRDG